MTPTACSSSAIIFDSRRNSSHSENHVHMGDVSTPLLPAGASCNMEISDLLAALTAPLLSGSTASTATNGSCCDSSSARGDCSSNNRKKSGNESGGREDGGPSSDVNEQSDEGTAGEGHTEGGCRRMRQGKQQQRQTVEHHPLWRRSVSCLVEKETAHAEVGRGETNGSGENETEKDVGENVSDTVTTREAPTFNSAAGFTATVADEMDFTATVADEMIAAILRRTTTSVRTTGNADVVASDDAASSASLSPGSQKGVEVHLCQEEGTEIQQQRAQRLRMVCRTEKKPEGTECRAAAQEILLTAPGLRRDAVDVPVRTAQCSSKAQQCAPPSLMPGEATTRQKEAAAGVTGGGVERKKGESICDDDVPCEAAQVYDQQKLDCHDKVNGQQREQEEKQQKTSSSVSPTTAVTTGESPEMQLRGHRSQERQQQIVVEQNHDGRWQMEQQERQQEKQHEQQEKRTQTDGVNDREGSRARGTAEEGEMRDGCGVRATCSTKYRGPVEEDECGAGKRTPTSGGMDKQQNTCDASVALQQDTKLLEELEHLQNAGCCSEDSTGSPSKRTSFEDAVEGAVGSEKQRNSTRPHQGLQWPQGQERKQQVLQQCSTKEEGEGHIEYELKKSVTAVLAVALRGKTGREAENEGTASYPPSPTSGETSSEGFTTSSFETAASSQWQSPLNVQKEEAAEGTGCGSTNNAGPSSTCSATNSHSHVSDTPAPIQDNNSAGPEKSNGCGLNRSSSLPCGSLTHRSGATRLGAAADSNKLATPSGSAPDNRRPFDKGDIRSSSWDTSALLGGDSPSGDSGVSGTSGTPGSNADGCDDGSASETSRLSRSSSCSTSGVSSAVGVQKSEVDSTSASGNKESVNGSAPACTGAPSKSNGLLLEACSMSQGAGSSRGPVDWTSAIVGAAVLEDCFHSVRDLEQHAARVLLVPLAQTGGAKQQVLLPSLLLQKTTMGDERRLTECSLWGEKREQMDTLTAARTAEALLFSASSAFGFYQPTQGDVAVGEIRKDPAGLMLVPPVPNGNIDLTGAGPGTCGLLPQQLTANPFSAGGGPPLLGTGTIAPGLPGTPAAVGTEAAAGVLEQSHSQMWMLQQHTGCLGDSLSPTAPSSIQLPSLAATFPWPPAGATPNIGAVASVVMTPAASAVAAAARLPRSFRSRSDYLSLCSLQGCPAMQENVRKPRTLEELRQLPSEEYISLQEMHLLAESLVNGFMKLQHSSLDSVTTNSRITARVRRQGAAQKNSKEDEERRISVTGNAAALVHRAEPLVLHYRRDNLSFSVTPASSFTPYPSSLLEGARKKTHPRNSGGSRVGLAVGDNMDEMEEEKKETLLGARCFTSSDFHVNSSCPPTSSDRTVTRRETAAREHVRKNSAGDGAHVSTAKGIHAEGFFPPRATTHLFRARCQQAGTETGISDSTIGAVDRAFAEATTSYFRELQRQNNQCALFSDSAGEAGVDEHGGKQQRTCSGVKGTTEEPHVNLGKADIRTLSTRTGGNATRSYQRLVPGSSSSSADWRQGRVN